MITDFQNESGLLIRNGAAVGYLLDFTEKGIPKAGSNEVVKGIWSPDGQIDVTPEVARIHNETLSQAEILGLDNAEVGQWGILYVAKVQNLITRVTTWTGTIVSTQIKVNGKSITFYRNGRSYRGILQKHSDCFNFKRIT